ncbi:hypothetical protein HMSSN139_16770 [Paenibacillus sp. HMSSN-139]|nr:hypothetical protein HMSSN139_16770 [Paenibacillus sp. HMSSN-139]
MEEKDKRKLDFAEGEAEASEKEALSPEGQAGQEEGGTNEPKEAEYDPADDADLSPKAPKPTRIRRR